MILPWHDEMASMDPAMWRVCYPRIYRVPANGNFHSPKLVSIQTFSIGLKVNGGARGESDIYELQVASAWAKYRVPIFFIAPNLMQAMTQTKTPQDIAWLTMKMPFEAAAFMLPKGTLFHPEEGEVVFIGYGRFHEGAYSKSLLTGQKFGLINGGMMLVALTEKGLFHHWNMPTESFGETLCLTDIEEYAESTLEEHRSAEYIPSWKNTPEDDKLMVRVAHYVFSTLLIMTERSEMVEMGRLEKKVQKGDSHNEFWSPNIVGGHYSVKYESGAPVGTHASPRLHFVRGFWRNQAHGEGRALRRLQWIEPFIRGAGEVSR